MKPRRSITGVAVAFVLSAFAMSCSMGSTADAPAEQKAQATSSVPVQRAPASAPTPFPKRLDDWPGRGWAQAFPWMGGNRMSFWKQRTAKQGAVVFAGDSLTASWATLDADFPRLLVANRGIGGDTSRGLLFRFQEDVLDLNPKAVVILIGTNDLSAKQAPADVVFNVSQLLAAAHQRRPPVPVVLCTLPPREDPKSVIDRARLLELNEGLTSLAAQRRGVWMLDLHPLFADASGAPIPAYFRPDRLHLSPEGHQQWRAAVTLRLSEIGITRAAAQTP